VLLPSLWARAASKFGTARSRPASTPEQLIVNQLCGEGCSCLSRKTSRSDATALCCDDGTRDFLIMGSRVRSPRAHHTNHCNTAIFLTAASLRDGGWLATIRLWLANFCSRAVLESSGCRKAQRPTQFLAACEASESRSACWCMSPRIIHIPLSGGDRRAQAKGIRYAHGIHESAYMWHRCWMGGVNDDFDAMIARCISAPRGRPRILLTGDSHAAHFISGFKRSLSYIDVDLLAVDTCSLTGMFQDANRPTCLAIIRLIDNLKKGDFDAVILTTQVVLNKDPVGFQKFVARVQDLTKVTAVYVLGPIQFYRPNMPTIYMRSVGKVSDAEMGKLFDTAVHPDPFEYDEALKRSLAKISGVKYISLLDIMCPGKQCQHFDAAGLPILIDDSHLSVAASYDLVGRIAERFEIGAISHPR
jgi:hypothetical protein